MAKDQTFRKREDGSMELVSEETVDRPGTPDTDGLLLAAFAPASDGGLGEDRAIALVQARPDLQIALARENWKVARGAVDRALQQGVIDQGEYDTIQGLFTHFNIPTE